MEIPNTQEQLVLARASIHLPGLALGQTAFVDRSDPYIADALENGYLVPESASAEEALETDEPTELDESAE